MRGPVANAHHLSEVIFVSMPEVVAKHAHPNQGKMISIIMPNFNHGHFLRTSILGLLNQTRPADEIIIIDDASTDDSVAIVRDFAKQNQRIRLIQRQERRGVVDNLNLGLAEAKGDLVAFLGADDLVFPGFIEKLNALLTDAPQAGFASASVEIRDEANVVHGTRPIVRPNNQAGYVGAEKYRQLLAQSDNHFLGAATLYRRDALNEVGGFDALLGPTSDGIAARRIAVRHGFCFDPAKLGVWRIHGNNYSLTLVTPDAATDKVFSRIDSVLRSEPKGLFPQDYPHRFAQRLRFGHGRLLAKDDRLTGAEKVRHLSALAGGYALDRLVFTTASYLGPLAPFLSIGWLTIRLRPYSLICLLTEQIRRN